MSDLLFWGIWAILLAAWTGGGYWLDWRCRGEPIWERKHAAREAGATLFLFACLWSVWTCFGAARIIWGMMQ